MAPRSRRIYLHVGLPKTGTTSLQELLWHHRDAVADDGVLYPGYDRATQHRAVIDVHPERYGRWQEAGVAGVWSWLVEQLRAWQGNSVVSAELLAPASQEEVAQVLSDLSFAEVHLVCTARDLARQIPSVWQENIKTRDTTSLPEFLTELRREDLTEVNKRFWDYQDLPRVLRVWSENLPPERVHVVTVPPRGTPTSVLWQRFTSVIDIDADKFTTDVPHHNFSLGVAETELLRRLNESLGDDIDWPKYAIIVKDQLAADILSHLHGPSHIPLPAGDYEWVVDTAKRFIDEIAAAGYHVVGDLTDLLPATPSEQSGGKSPATPTDSEMLDVAVQTLAGFVKNMPTPEPPLSKRQRLTRSVRQRAEQYPQVLTARRMYWRAKARLRRPR
ncbi:MAG: hypothetical protein GEU98_03965 [Pseudonocardiaceae bacterium]|nr:hypothetical protein [Pseudonocardiaceae bacterium]